MANWMDCLRSRRKCNADIDAAYGAAADFDFETYGPTLVIGTHFAGATAGRVVRDGDAYRLEV